MQKRYEEFPDVLNVVDIQKILGIGRKQAYELVHSEKFHVINIGKRLKVSKNVLIKWIEGANNDETTN